MFSLIVGFWRLFFKREEFQILILGVDRAGKTTLLEQLKALFTGLDPLPPSKIPPTVGLNIGRMQVSRAKLIFWDLGGSSSLRSLWENYYSEAHGLVYVVDASDHERMEESKETLHNLLNHPDLAAIPLLLFANKQDAEAAISPQEIETRFGCKQIMSRSQPLNVQGTTALSGEGVQEGVLWLVESLRSSSRAMGMQH
uniref:ADP-ribosylation factor-related protein 1 n=1 Tax=Haptolina ericina TaxID=156174 RepID=A0A7S3FMI8_9EUKA|mmetsp:Transcript_7443/g.16641  ORF Transcript_7443/g.16641 Transcript_7443/m.16641 type:complete len:198 (+) Transcript_7443:29-622(+)